MLYWLIVHWTKLFWIDVILYKNKTSQGTSIIFFSFEVYQIPHIGKFDCARRTCITAYPNTVTKSQRDAKITLFLRKKKRIKKWRVVVLRISWCFCGCFKKHSMGKHKENLRTVYNLFDHWNMALSSVFRHPKTLLATRLVFHLFWRWQPVAHAPFQQPRNAAVLKRSRPRTSDTAIWASLIVAGPYFLALLPWACHLVSRCVAQVGLKQLCGFASWPFSGSIYMYHSLNLNWLS